MDKPRVAYHVRFLSEELALRQARNSAYSLRAFAKFLDQHPSALSRVLAGKQELSVASCVVILKKLKLKAVDARLFIASVAEERRARASALLVQAIEPELLMEDFDIDEGHVIDFTSSEPLALSSVALLERDLISAMDLEGRFIYANNSVSKELGVIGGQIIGTTWKDLIPSESLSAVLQGQESELRTQQKKLRFEFTVESEGHARWYERTLTPIYGTDKVFKAFMSHIRDITETKLSDERNRFSLQASHLVHSSLDESQTLSNIARAAIPFLAEVAVVAIRDGMKWKALSSGELGELARPLLPPRIVQDAAMGSDKVVVQAPIYLDLQSVFFASLKAAQAAFATVQCVKAIPLNLLGKNVGVLLLAMDRKRANAIGDNTAAVADFAAHAAQAIANAALYQESPRAIG